MGTSEPKSWAEIFTAELVVEGERIPFERVLARHLDAIAKLRTTSGHTWPSIASMLLRAGARRSDGSLISADQIRVGYARLVRNAKLSEEQTRDKRKSSKRISGRQLREPPASRGTAPAQDQELVASLPKAPRAIRPHSSDFSTDSKDVSGEEITSVLERLSKLNSKS
jgi:hypothetical protein